VDQNTPAIGEHAAEMLLRTMKSKKAVKPQVIEIEPRLIVRESTRLAPAVRDRSAAVQRA
jgi:DNA-binding LacI/PurR family transcriptional regulator